MNNFFKNKKILIVVAHPDDELLGLGATMNKLINEYNIKTHVVILGEGITSRSEKRDSSLWSKELTKHKKNVEKAKNIIGYHSVVTYDYPDNRFDSIDLLEIIKTVEKEKNIFKPDIVFTHHGGDLNIDHQKTFEAVLTACRPLENESVKTIITFETMSGTEWRANVDPRHFLPNFFVSFDNEHMENKIKAMESYEFERRKFPHPRSPEALRVVAKRWGISIGVKYAEAFCIIRHIL